MTRITIHLHLTHLDCPKATEADGCTKVLGMNWSSFGSLQQALTLLKVALTEQLINKQTSQEGLSCLKVALAEQLITIQTSEKALCFKGRA